MKKNVPAYLSILLFLFQIFSCTTDKGDIASPAPEACDTANVSYSQLIKPIIETKCFGAGSSCHGPGAIGQPRFDQYSLLTDPNNLDKIPGSIKHESGFPAMPQGSSKLPSCEINQIIAWISQGHLNN